LQAQRETSQYAQSQSASGGFNTANGAIAPMRLHNTDRNKRNSLLFCTIQRTPKQIQFGLPANDLHTFDGPISSKFKLSFSCNCNVHIEISPIWILDILAVNGTYFVEYIAMPQAFDHFHILQHGSPLNGHI